MSRYTYTAHGKNGKPLQVTIGWDPGLLGYFLTVQKASNTGVKSGFLFNNLMKVDSHPKQLDGYLLELENMGIAIDSDLIQLLIADAKAR
jgi:hypothetical protein